MKTIRTSTCLTPQAQVSGKNGPQFIGVLSGKALIRKFRFRRKTPVLIYLKANVYSQTFTTQLLAWGRGSWDL